MKPTAVSRINMRISNGLHNSHTTVQPKENYGNYPCFLQILLLA